MFKINDKVRINTVGTSFDGCEAVVIATPVNSYVRIWVRVNGYDVEIDRQHLEHITEQPTIITGDSAINQPVFAIGDTEQYADVTFKSPVRVERMVIMSGPFQTSAYGWAYQVKPISGAGSVIVPESRVTKLPFGWDKV